MDRSITMMAVLITGKVIHAKRGNPIGFVSFEGLSGLYDVTSLHGRVSVDTPSGGHELSV
jgi:hypothetical protein